MSKYVSMNKGFSLNAPLDADTVGKYLSGLGTFTTKKLHALAKNKTNPLHRYVEWDTKKAAYAYQLSQIRMVVLSVGFETDAGPSRTHESVVIDKQRVYVPITKIAESENLVDQVVQSAMRELIFWKAKHQRLKFLFGEVFDAIDKTEGALRRNSEKADKGKKRGVKARNTANKKGDRRRHDSGRQPIAS